MLQGVMELDWCPTNPTCQVQSLPAMCLECEVVEHGKIRSGYNFHRIKFSIVVKMILMVIAVAVWSREWRGHTVTCH